MSMLEQRLARRCLPVALALTLACRTAGAPADAPAAPPVRGPQADGLWEGVLVYKPGELEADIAVELARQPNGTLVGTIDVPNQQIKFHPLENVQAEGPNVSFVFSRYSETAQMMVVSPITATVSADGRSMSGEFLEGGKNRVPFVLVRKGEAGNDRQEPPLSALHPLSGDGAELKEAFNRDRDKTRLILLLSPT
jgi:hypothetical protein